MFPKSALLGLAAASTAVGQGFEVVIKHVQPTDGSCSCPSGNEVFPTLAIGPGSGSDTDSDLDASPTYAASPSATYQDGPVDTIKPAVHWSCDTSKVENVIPKPAADASPMYYGSSDPKQEGYYGWLNYHFSTPAVNLDESDHVSCEYDQSSSGLTLKFSNQEAFDLACKHWDASSGLVLVAYIAGCGEDHDRCYFKVADLEIKDGELVIIASGSSQDPHDLIDKASTEFGWWVPGRTKGSSQAGGNYGGYYGGSSGGSGSGSGSGSSATGSGGSSATQTFSVTIAPTATGSSSSGSGSSTGSGSGNSTSSGSGSGSFTGTGTFTNSTSDGNTTTSGSFTDNVACTAPVDTKYGLPTACLGEYFDMDLDDQQGYDSIKNDSTFKEFIEALAPDTDSDNDALRRRWWNPIKAIINVLPPAIKNPINNFVQKIQEATSIKGSINKSMSFKLPDPSSSDPAAKTPKDPSLKQTKSPWGDAILLKSFGDSEKLASASGSAAYLNVFCVDCGVEGGVKVAGRAAWTPIGMTFTEGQLEVHADIKMGLKLGVDAKIKYTKAFQNSILDLGLPGLTYGIVTIGPRVSVGSSVTFNAAAEGKLLAGAEMGVADGMVVLDWVNYGNSKSQGWEPYFKPVFEADGQIMLSAELGLPVTVACGVKISSWDKSVSITDTPSLKATAMISGSIGTSSAAGFTGALTSTDGCAGIATSISWRNKIDVNVIDLYKKTLYDTNDRTIKQSCIKLSSNTDSTPTTTAGQTGTTGTNTGSETGSETGTTNTATAGEEPTNTASPTNTEESTPESSSTEGSAPESSSTEGSTPEPSSTEGSAPESSGTESTPPVESSLAERSIAGRFAFPNINTTAVTSTVNATAVAAAINATVLDLTAKVKGSDSFSYTPSEIKSSGYNQTDGYDFSLMVDSNVETKLVSCGDGNVYLAGINETSMTYCTELFASYQDLLVQDGASRYMHYYNNTMNAVNVSRMRVANEDDVPNEAVLVIMIPFNSASANESDPVDPDTDDNYSYYAIDAYEQILYPTVCTYQNNDMPRMFLVKDPENGPEMLKSADLKYSVTGGDVQDCFLMSFVEAKYGEDDDFTSEDTSSDVTLDYDDE